MYALLLHASDEEFHKSVATPYQKHNFIQKLSRCFFTELSQQKGS